MEKLEIANLANVCIVYFCKAESISNYKNRLKT